MFSFCRLLLQIQQELERGKGRINDGDIWVEFVSNLWDKYLPHVREEFYDDGRLVFDPITELYGFQVEKIGDERYRKEFEEEEDDSIAIQDPVEEDNGEDRHIILCKNQPHPL